MDLLTSVQVARALRSLSARTTQLISRAVAPSVYQVEILEPRRLLSATFYVATNGSDANSGTDPAHPFATIQAALNQANVAGDVVQVAGGTYRGQFNTHFVASGTSGAPITLQAAPGQTVIVDGAELITGWTEVGTSPVYTYTNWNEYFAPQATGTNDARSDPRDQLFVDGQYLPEVTSLSQISPGTLYVSPSGTHAIDVWLADSSSPNSHTMEGTATASPLFTTYSGSSWTSNVVINGLQFQDCANVAQSSNAAVQVNGGQNVTVENVTVQYAAGAGIGLSTSNTLVKNCHFNHNGQEGIASSASTNLSIIDCETAYNNTLPSKQYDVLWEAGATKFVESTGVIVDGLVSHDNYGDGLWFDYENTGAIIRNCVISNNYGYGIHYEVSYTATIYNNLIFNNHFHYNYQSGVDGYGIFLSSSIGCVVYNNTIVGNDSVGFVSSGQLRGYFFSYANEFFNNIVVSSGPAVLIGDVSAATATNVPAGTTLSYPYAYSQSDYNIYYNAADNPNNAIAGYYTTLAAWQAAGLDTHSQFTNPLFANQSDNQFQLGANSTLSTAGTTSWPGVTIQEANPQMVGAHFDTLPSGSDDDNMPVAVTGDASVNTSANSLTYNVVFSEPVTNVTTAAFALTSTGTATGTITGVSASSGTNFAVTVSSVSGTGTLRLDVLPNSIQDKAGAGKTVLAYQGGLTTAVPLATTPAVTSIVPFTTGATSSNFLQYLVTFNEPVTGVTPANFQVTTTGTVTGSIVPQSSVFANPISSDNGSTYEVIVGPTNSSAIVGPATNTSGFPDEITGHGTLGLNFVDGTGNVQNAAGNSAPAYSSGAVANIVDPAVTLTAPANGAATTNTQPTFSGAAGTASGDSASVTINIYAGVGTGGTVAQTLAATPSAGTYTVPAAAPLSIGTYTAQASQSDSAGTFGFSSVNVFTITTATASGGSVVGTASTAAASYNLTTLGTSDWAHWGLNGSGSAFDHKATGNSQISIVTAVGAGGYGGYSDSSRTVSWTDGMPVASDTADHGYIWANNALGAGYSFTVPASTTTHTVYVYLGGYSSGGTLTAHLSDTSAADYSVSISGAAHYSDVVAITYNAASAGQSLTLTYVKSQNISGTGGSVDLIAAWLAGPAVTSAPVVTTNPSSQALTVGQDAKFTAAASGNPAATVQWLVETPGSGSFAAIAGATSTTLDLGAATLAEGGNQYEATFTNGVGSPATASAATLTVNAPASGGSVAGTALTAAASYNLTALGTSDWAHWGLNGSGSAFDHKATGNSQISIVTAVGAGGYGGYSDSSRTVSWTDGMPVASDTADHGYIWANNALGAGYSFTVPASTTTHTVYVYLGGYSSGGTLTAHLSDTSAADYSVSISGAAHYSDVVAITYNAASAGQSLTLTYVKSQNISGTGGSVDLIAAWLV
jgi:parallel beta-helix repeat protein